MTEKEEFLAYLKRTSEVVDKWPSWKKNGLTPPGLEQAQQKAAQYSQIVKPVILVPNAK